MEQIDSRDRLAALTPPFTGALLKLEIDDPAIFGRMVEAGLDALRSSGALEIELGSDHLLVQEIFLAMATALHKEASR